MRKLNIIFVTVLLIFIGACKEEPIGQYPVDKVAPQKVANPVVENFKGGASITYDLPEEDDLLYVKAVYTLPTGKKKEEKASIFVNKITINGFAKSAKTEIRLISVDRSQNESDAVLVEIEPQDSPIFDVYESLNVSAGFGGIKLFWQNPEEIDIVLGIVYKNEENELMAIDNFYTSAASGSGAVRGLEPVETQFGVFIRDIYDNYTDTIFTTLTPWEETPLLKELWKEMPLCPSFERSPYGNTSMRVMWDGINVGHLSSGGYSTYYIGALTDEPLFFTFDLGVSAQLSRFRFWGRDNFFFNLHHPKEFEIWGTNDPAVANAGPCEWDGWILLGSYVSTKPSGDELVAHNQLSSEDIALAFAGEEFEFPVDVPQVRYIRFKTLRTWSDSQSLFISELAFWGNPQ